MDPETLLTQTLETLLDLLDIEKTFELKQELTKTQTQTLLAFVRSLPELRKKQL